MLEVGANSNYCSAQMLEVATTNDEDGRQAAGTSAIISVITHGVPGSLFSNVPCMERLRGYASACPHLSPQAFQQMADATSTLGEQQQKRATGNGLSTTLRSGQDLI